MRLAPLLTAITVLVSLYLLIMERPMLLALAGAAPAETVQTAAVGPETPSERRLSVVVERIEEREMESAVVLRGRTEAARQVEVRAETSGLVVSDPLPRGSRVAEGDVMCELDPGTRRASLAEAEARLAEAEINYTTATRLSEDGFAAQTRVACGTGRRPRRRGRGRGGADRTEPAADPRPLRRAAGDRHRRARLAPVAGRAVRHGVLRLDPMLLVGLRRRGPDRPAGGRRAAGARLSNGVEVVGQVTFLARSADPATRTFRVEVTVPNPDLRIRDGMSADLMIAATSDRGHLVPGSALTLDDAGRLGLRLIDGDSRTFFAPVRVLRDTAEGVLGGGPAATGRCGRRGPGIRHRRRAGGCRAPRRRGVAPCCASSTGPPTMPAWSWPSWR
jgi:membrane fusion protein, multidrug efflux system